MRRFEAAADIAAPPDRVWAVLTDPARLVAGDIGVTRIEGEIAAGARFRLWTEATGRRAFRLRVAEFTPPAGMVWEGGLPFGLFRGVRRFTLTPQAGGTRFHMAESFSGPLAPLIGRSLPDLTPAFRRFAEGIRTMAEA